MAHSDRALERLFCELRADRMCEASGEAETWGAAPPPGKEEGP